MAECKETFATMLDVQVQTAGGYAAAAKRGEAARPARQAAVGNVRVPERAAEAAPTPAEAELMRSRVATTRVRKSRFSQFLLVNFATLRIFRKAIFSNEFALRNVAILRKSCETSRGVVTFSQLANSKENDSL